MKGKSAGFYASSLEMLLDTMCNMLGAVVFIALMVAIVAQDSVTRTPAQYREQQSQLAAELNAVAASNMVAQAELQAILKRLQDPREHPKTNIMRLPNLANTTKQPWVVIAQHDKLFPLDVFSADGRVAPVLNSHEIVYEPHSHFVETREQFGEEPEDAMRRMIDAFKSNGKTNFYFAFWVYNDSFDTFIRARETADRLGYQYGWSPLPQGQRLQVGRQGERVLPQN